MFLHLFNLVQANNGKRGRLRNTVVATLFVAVLLLGNLVVILLVVLEAQEVNDEDEIALGLATLPLLVRNTTDIEVFANRSDNRSARIGEVDGGLSGDLRNNGRERSTLVPDGTLPEFEFNVVVGIDVVGEGILSPGNVALVFAVILLGPVFLDELVVVVTAVVNREALVNEILVDETFSNVLIATEPEVEDEPITVGLALLLPSTETLLESALVVVDAELSEGTGVSPVQIVLVSIMEPVVEDQEALEVIRITEALLLEVTVGDVRASLLPALDVRDANNRVVIHSRIPVHVAGKVVVVSVRSQVLPLSVVAFSDQITVITDVITEVTAVEAVLNSIISLFVEESTSTDEHHELILSHIGLSLLVNLILEVVSFSLAFALLRSVDADSAELVFASLLVEARVQSFSGSR